MQRNGARNYGERASGTVAPSLGGGTTAEGRPAQKAPLAQSGSVPRGSFHAKVRVELRLAALQKSGSVGPRTRDRRGYFVCCAPMNPAAVVLSSATHAPPHGCRPIVDVPRQQQTYEHSSRPPLTLATSIPLPSRSALTIRVNAASCPCRLQAAVANLRAAGARKVLVARVGGISLKRLQKSGKQIRWCPIRTVYFFSTHCL